MTKQIAKIIADLAVSGRADVTVKSANALNAQLQKNGFPSLWKFFQNDRRVIVMTCHQAEKFREEKGAFREVDSSDLRLSAKGF